MDCSIFLALFGCLHPFQGVDPSKNANAQVLVFRWHKVFLSEYLADNKSCQMSRIFQVPKPFAQQGNIHTTQI